jgi:signal transduction histidine kinase
LTEHPTVLGLEGGWWQSSAEKHLEFACAVPPGVPWQLRGDSWRLRQVLANLITNALNWF